MRFFKTQVNIKGLFAFHVRIHLSFITENSFTLYVPNLD